jgi:hypothetical protein
MLSRKFPENLTRRRDAIDPKRNLMERIWQKYSYLSRNIVYLLYIFSNFYLSFLLDHPPEKFGRYPRVNGCKTFIHFEDGLEMANLDSGYAKVSIPYQSIQFNLAGSP